MNRQYVLPKYQEILQEYMEKVRKNIPKQYPSFKDFLNKMIDLVKYESLPKLGKHNVVFRLTINMRQTKLTQLALSTLFRLVSNGFIDGRIEDTSQEFYTDEFSELFNDSNYNKGEKRTIMDVLINSVTSCLFDKDEIIIQGLKLLVAFVLNPYCYVTSQNLTRIVRTIIFSYTRSRTQTVDRNTKNMLYQIINYTFQAVEGEVFTIQRNKRRMSIKEDSVQKLTQLVMLQLVDMVCLNRTSLNFCIQSDIQNERNQPAGYFGYCIMCRKSANLYCKDHRVPICSFICKKQHQEYVEQAQSTYSGAVKQFEENLDCALQLYDSLCNLLLNKTTLEQAKNQQIILECLLYILETPDFVLSKNEKFIKTTKERLCNQLLKYCLETEKTLYQFSFRIFQRLVNIMRKSIKHEMAIFINQIYLNILLSANSNVLHKQTALESLCSILERPKTGLEFYINYDCHTKHECLMSKIINTFYEIIVVSIYQKAEYQISTQQEILLKYLAIKALSYVIEGLNKIFDKFIITPSEEIGSPQMEDQNANVNDNTTVMYINPIEIQRQLKQEIMKGCQIFRKNPDKGIKYLLDAQIIQNDAKEIAKFFRENQQQVSKDAIGAFLGGHQQLNIKVLSEFTDMLKFKDLTVEQALRYYLDQFTLPGEAMQVDRVVQKFSDRYYKENPNSTFKSSGSIYTYCYLLVMLQTDLHNPSVAEKMKLIDFQKLARSINDGDDLPQDYLTQTYNSILKQPLAVREKEKSRVFMKESLTQSIRKKQDLFQREKEALLKQGSELIKTKQDSHETLYQIINQDMAYLIKPFLECIGKPSFEMFLFVFNNDQMEQASNQCIQGLVLFIKLCSFFSIPLQDYMNTLIKATRLNNQGQISNKHINLIKQILQTVPLIGNGLRENGWKSILKMISRLDEMRMIQQSKDNQDGQNISILPELLLESDLIDKIFVQSKQLDDEAIQEFINALCYMSKQEIYQTHPRLFCLQKLVEVCDYNMKRVSFVWTKMWNIVKDHINEVAVKEKKVAMFTVDSLKQLSIKFLQKDELYDFQFQRDVLKPFETIFLQSNLEVKEFILSCINHIVLNHKHNIRSGWRMIFGLIALGLKEENDKICKIAFQILSQIMEHNLDLLQDVFIDLIQTLKVLAGKNQEDMALASIDFTIKCLGYLSKQAQIIPKLNWNEFEEPEATVRNASTAVQLEKIWIPLLGVLSQLAGDKRNKIQAKSMEALFETLQQFGYAFSAEFWKMVFSTVLRPIFDEIQFTFQQNYTVANTNNDWFKDSCKKGFSLIINLMKRYFQKLRGLLPEFLKLFENCIQNQNVKLAKYSIHSVKNMTLKIGMMFNEEEWEQIIQFIDRMIRLTTPTKLSSFANQSLTSSRMRNMIEDCFTQCTSQLLIIQISIEILQHFNQKLNLQQLQTIENTFLYSYQFAVQFNSQIEQRYLIWKQGVLQDMKFLPGLLKQEREAYGCMIIIKKYKLKNHNILDIDSLIQPIDVFIKKHEMIRTNTQFPEELDQQMQKLKLQEIERETQNYRQLLDTYILPTLCELNVEHLKQNNQQLFLILLKTLSYSNDSIICKECIRCQKCLQQEKSNLDQQLLQLVQKLYDLK
ncbi:unnamed protein product [Paramecium pentaurelia]|uniref:SEC7 domain-containing protein n=1 Tax=Paramecium pentaurelia TaxID=43138 RepID=A0A8S1XH98_9CILI|nr:unnamed protein product [Paramecium pentaurelia]